MQSTQYALERDGDIPLIFDGHLITVAASEKHAGRWYEFAMYDHAGQLVVAICFRSEFSPARKKSPEPAFYFARHAADLQDARDILQDFDVLPTGRGYPPIDRYADRQAALRVELQAVYNSAVGRLLTDPKMMFYVDMNKVTKAFCPRCGSKSLDTSGDSIYTCSACRCGFKISSVLEVPCA